MTETGPGIVVTRTFTLPFAPVDGIRVHSKQFDDGPDPIGFTLKEVVWDIDREVFLAETTLIHQDLPMAFIADDIRDWIGRGWRLGSLRDGYAEPNEQDESADTDPPVPASGAPSAHDESERLHTLAPQRRPREFNRLFKAIVRHMAEVFMARDVAFAMDQTGRFFSEADVADRREDPAVRKWEDLRHSFARLSQDEQFAWRDRAMRHPGVAEVIRG